ncbi:hypothetical protein [Rheinheimera aquimaris]|uniref:hypothetical protein n=1 Tax=Rheinheimera aquimaris TaxID=412437 RepID=UPI003A98547A
MNEASLELLAALKKTLSEQGAKIDATVSVAQKQKNPVASVNAPKQAKQPKPAKSKKANSASKPKRPDGNSIAKKRKNRKSVKPFVSPRPALISDFQPAPKKQVAMVEPLILSNSSAEFKPKFNVKHRFTVPEWFNSGQLLQHPDQQENTVRPITVRIGIDFGTAFTKVAVKIGLDTLIIDWSALTGVIDLSSRNLLPGIVTKAVDGQYSWQNFNKGTVLTNLKLPLLSDGSLEQSPSASIAYLAYVIRYTRAAVYKHPEFGRKLALSNIRWELNVGCATEPHDKIQIVEKIQKVALVAWHLSSKNDLSDGLITSLWHKSLGLAGLEALPGVVPEFIAQIAGYLSSPQLREGLHILVDVGAATLDVASFNVVQDRENHSVKIPIFFSRVVKQGTHFLNLHRHTQLSLTPSWDDTSLIQSRHQFAKDNNLDVLAVEKVDLQFKKAVVDTIYYVIKNTKTSLRGDPNSIAWESGLPVFLTGGGSAFDLYKSAIGAAEQLFKNNYQLNHRFRLVPYDTNTLRYSSLKEHVDGRLTVALGLTEDAESIARIIPSRDIFALERCEKLLKSHSELYAK